MNSVVLQILRTFAEKKMLTIKKNTITRIHVVNCKTDGRPHLATPGLYAAAAAVGMLKVKNAPFALGATVCGGGGLPFGEQTRVACLD